ncbi:MAG: glycosyltransferase family 2 protein [Candidatus Omnitrophota bacterium]
MDIQPVILIPCYNCGRAVLNVIDGCRAYTPRILAVNDGSVDDTAACLAESGAAVIGWPVNRGKGAALREGFDYWLKQDDWNVLITLDSDGQHDPADLPLLLDVFQRTRADIVIGRRSFNVKDVPPLRRWANNLSSSLISWIASCPIHDFQSGYRLHSRVALQSLLPRLSTATFALETEILLLAHRLGMRLEETNIRCIYSQDSSRRSSWRPLIDSWRIAKAVARVIRMPKP